MSIFHKMDAGQAGLTICMIAGAIIMTAFAVVFTTNSYFDSKVELAKIEHGCTSVQESPQ